MANPGYVRSSDGDNADNGSTWALANADLTGAIADQVAGDRIFVADDHAQTQASALTLTFPGTFASPNQILFGDDTAEPPTSLVTTGSVTTTSASNIILGGSFYWYGGTISAGTTGSGYGGITLGNGDAIQYFDNVKFKIGGTNSAAGVAFGATTGGSESSVICSNCTMEFTSATQGVKLNQCYARIQGGGIASGSAAITTFINSAPAEGRRVLVEGFDFSNAASTINLIASGAAAYGLFIFRNCKMPTSWSGSLLAGAPATAVFRASMYNCSATDTNYQMWVEDYYGSIKHETTLVLTGGASDGDTTISWKMASSANVTYPVGVLRSPEIFVPNTTTGASKTLTVEILHDSATALDDDEIWLEVQYLGTSGTPLSLFTNDSAATVIATPAAQTSSSATWTTTGMTNPNKQKLAATFTPQEEGVYICVVVLAKASYTVYVDPLVTVS